MMVTTMLMVASHSTSVFAWLLSPPPEVSGTVLLISITRLVIVVVAERALAACGRAEKRLQATENLRHNLVQHSLGLMCVHDEEGVLLSVNPAAAEAIGLDPEQCVGRCVREALAPAVRREFDDYLDRIQKNRTDSGLMRLKAKDGSDRIWLYRNVLYEEPGQPPRVLGHAQDVTALKRAEKQLRESQEKLNQAAVTLEARVEERTQELETAHEEQRRLAARIQQAQKIESLGLMAGGVAHDFNNLLVGVLGFAELALEDLPSRSAARPHIEEVLKAGDKARDLTGQMLAYAGRGRFVTELADLSRLTEETIQLLRSTISPKAALQLHLAEHLPATNVDATQARQVVMNLLTNASEALGDHDGTIRVETGTLAVPESDVHSPYLGKGLAQGRYVYLEVADSGCGMDDEQKAKIFDPFFTTKFTGRGLGLAAVLGIVRGHKGSITVDSEPGHGSKIKVLFPAWREEPLARSHSSSTTPAKWHGSGTILLVDDEKTVRAAVGAILERMGFHVVMASDGVSALSIVREKSNEIAAVLLDWTMPGISGEDVLRELLRIRPETPVIVSSGFTSEDISEKLPATGVGFIQKPYASADLIEKLREIL
jgi:PAS domain S-box-containing protein